MATRRPPSLSGSHSSPSEKNRTRKSGYSLSSSLGCRRNRGVSGPLTFDSVTVVLFVENQASGLEGVLHPRRQSTVQVEGCNHQVVGLGQEQVVIQITLDGVDGQPSLSRGLPDLLKGRLGDVNRVHFVPALGQVDGITSVAAGQVQGASTRQALPPHSTSSADGVLRPR